MPSRNASSRFGPSGRAADRHTTKKNVIFTIQHFAPRERNTDITLLSFHPQPALGVSVLPSSKDIACLAG